MAATIPEGAQTTPFEGRHLAGLIRPVESLKVSTSGEELTALVAERRSGHLKALTGLRFYAALLVVVHHVTHDLAPVPFLREIFIVGGVGVSFFFVLSGFVLMWTRNPDASSREFYRNRFARVFPLHAITWAAAGAFLFITAGRLDPAVAVATLILLQSWIPLDNFYFGMNGPSWSLSCEAFFYAAFPWLSRRIAPVSIRKGIRLIIGLFVVAAVISVVGHLLLRDGPSVGLLYVNPLYRIWEFAIGMVLALLVKRGWRTRVRPKTAAGITVGAFLVVAGLNYLLSSHVGPLSRLPLAGVPSDLASLALTPCFVLLIASVTCAELSGTKLHVQSPLFVRLGEWSFALYISHLIIVEALRYVVPQHLPWLPSTLLAIGTISLAVALSALLYRYVEKPLQRQLRATKAATAARY